MLDPLLKAAPMLNKTAEIPSPYRTMTCVFGKHNAWLYARDTPTPKYCRRRTAEIVTTTICFTPPRCSQN